MLEFHNFTGYTNTNKYISYSINNKGCEVLKNGTAYPAN